MKIKKFDVVELKNKNKAVILEIYKRKKYYAEIVNDKGNTIDKKEITSKEIDKIIYRKEIERYVGMVFVRNNKYHSYYFFCHF